MVCLTFPNLRRLRCKPCCWVKLVGYLPGVGGTPPLSYALAEIKDGYPLFVRSGATGVIPYSTMYLVSS